MSEYETLMAKAKRCFSVTRSALIGIDWFDSEDAISKQVSYAEMWAKKSRELKEKAKELEVPK